MAETDDLNDEAIALVVRRRKLIFRIVLWAGPFILGFMHEYVVPIYIERIVNKAIAEKRISVVSSEKFVTETDLSNKIEQFDSKVDLKIKNSVGELDSKAREQFEMLGQKQQDTKDFATKGIHRANANLQRIFDKTGIKPATELDFAKVMVRAPGAEKDEKGKVVDIDKARKKLEKRSPATAKEK